MAVKVAFPRNLVVPGLTLTALTQSVEMGRVFKEELLRVQGLYKQMQDILVTDYELQENN